MDAAAAQARLARMTGASQDPVLDPDALADLLQIAARVDAYLTEPNAPGWVGTYDLHAAAAVGWSWKAAAVAHRIDVSDGGISPQRSQLYDHCLAMVTHHEAHVVGSVPVVSDRRALWARPAGVIGNL